jgi:hypothetical protein
MYKAGYDPRYLARFFEKLARMSAGGGPQFLSDHPAPANRTQAIDDEVRSWPPKDFVNDSEAFQRMHEHARSLQLYSAQEIAAGARTGRWAQQNREGGYLPASEAGGTATSSSRPRGGGSSSVSYRDVRPSGNLTPARDDAFTISYPDNWRLYRDQDGNGVTIAPPAGVTQGAVAYGVVINSANPDSSSLDQAVQDVISSLEQSNAGLRPSGRPQPVRVNGVEGRSVDLRGESPIEEDGRPAPEHDWLIVLPRPQGGMLYAVFIAPERDFTELRPTFENMLRSLHLR